MAQVGILSMRAFVELGQWITPQPLPGTNVHYFSSRYNFNAETNGLSPTTLFSARPPIKITSLLIETLSSAVLPGGPQITIGIWKNGILINNFSHNGTEQYFAETFSVNPGDLIEIRGNTTDPAILMRLNHFFFSKIAPGAPLIPTWLHYHLIGGT